MVFLFGSVCELLIQPTPAIRKTRETNPFNGLPNSKNCFIFAGQLYTVSIQTFLSSTSANEKKTQVQNSKIIFRKNETCSELISSFSVSVALRCQCVCVCRMRLVF